MEEVHAGTERISRRSYVRRGGRRALSFLKEWGGLATLMIAVLYTFPFEAFDRYVNWSGRSLQSARAAITAVADLSAQRTLAIAQIKDDIQARSFLTNMYNIRIYNIMITNKRDFIAAGAQLSAGELYSVGSNFTLIGAPGEALFFYDLALKASFENDKGAYATTSRELGYTLALRGPLQDVPKAIKAYLDSVTTLANKEYWLDQRNYSQYISELALVEMDYGDWSCGVSLSKLSEQAISAMAMYDPSIREMGGYFQNAFSTRTKRIGQGDAGCRYELPRSQVLFP
jgi:hypothetical protein